jgi:lytic murein transglycosylase
MISVALNVDSALSSSAKADDPVITSVSAFTGCPAGACHRAGHFGPDPLAGHDRSEIVAAGVARRLCAISLICVFTLITSGAFADDAFQAWLQSLWPQAQELGVARATFDDATRGLEPDLTLPDLVLPGRPEKPQPGQAEFVETPADYLKESTIDRLAVQGRKLFNQYHDALAAIERQFGVAPTVVLAIFGRETDYGRSPDSLSAIRVLATQAYFGKRKEKFLNEFLLALKILQEGQIKLADMRSSWAGAMGLTQFLPSDYLKYAVDFDGDGRADIWNSVPDALASAAKQLRDKGWQPGLRWAYEVHPPANVDCTIGVPENTLPIGDWLTRGFLPAYGRRISAAERAQTASLLQPAGLYGPSFLATANYFAIKEYNFSDLYVLFVGHLSDSIADPRPFETPWGKVAQLSTGDLDRMQEILTARGYYHDKIDGKAGMLTRAALGAYQKRNGLKLDCWPSAALLAHMEAEDRN